MVGNDRELLKKSRRSPLQLAEAQVEGYDDDDDLVGVLSDFFPISVVAGCNSPNPNRHLRSDPQSYHAEPPEVTP